MPVYYNIITIFTYNKLNTISLQEYLYRVLSYKKGLHLFFKFLIFMKNFLFEDVNQT